MIPVIMFSTIANAARKFQDVNPRVNVKVHDLVPAQQIKALDNHQIDIAVPGQLPQEVLANYDIELLCKIPLMAVLDSRQTGGGGSCGS